MTEAQTLEDKLKEILKAASVSGKYGETKEATYLELIAQIKQVFTNEGWHKNVLKPEGDATFVVYPCMTGQAWFDRFKLELDYDGEIVIMGREIALKAARKASGINKGGQNETKADS